MEIKRLSIRKPTITAETATIIGRATGATACTASVIGERSTLPQFTVIVGVVASASIIALLSIVILLYIKYC
jgi:hypothetical protein